MLDFSARASPSLRNPTSFCYKSLLFGELLQVAIAICEDLFFMFHLPSKIVERLNMPQAFAGDGTEGQRTEKVD